MNEAVFSGACLPVDLHSEFLLISQLLSLLFEDLFKRFNAEVNIKRKLMIGVLSRMLHHGALR